MSIHKAMFGDILALTKPKITLMAVLVAAAGLMHAHSTSLNRICLTLIAIAFLVSGASALNMFFERELDKKMLRTKDRPLPSGRLHPKWGAIVGLVLSLLALTLMFFFSNNLAMSMGLLSLVLYVFVYTPLKTKSWTALLIGSIPGAMPVALGYISIANVLDFKALSLFLWAFLWQIPHFLAISIFREQEYTNAGFLVVPAVFGVRASKVSLLITSWLLVLSTLLLFYSQVISFFNLIIALVMGALFLFVCHSGFIAMPTNTWAKRAFKASLFYQSLLFLVIIIEALQG